MKDYYDEDKYLKAKNYSIEKGKINLISSTLSTLITLLFLVFEGYGWLDNFISHYYDFPVKSNNQLLSGKKVSFPKFDYLKLYHS